jgi:hypothetical protein
MRPSTPTTAANSAFRSTTPISRLGRRHAYALQRQPAVASDKHPFLLGTMVNLNTSAHTVDLDGSTTQSGGQYADASVWAIPMELVAGGGGGGGSPCGPVIIGGRAEDLDDSAWACGR